MSDSTRGLRRARIGNVVALALCVAALVMNVALGKWPMVALMASCIALNSYWVWSLTRSIKRTTQRYR